jgi:hypothetical protein
LFHELATEISKAMDFSYNKDEANNVTEYLKWIYTISKEKSTCH